MNLEINTFSLLYRGPCGEGKRQENLKNKIKIVALNKKIKINEHNNETKLGLNHFKDPK